MKETVRKKIGKLKKQGNTNNQIIEKLKKQGIVPTKIEARRQLNEYHLIYGTEMSKKYRRKKAKTSYKKDIKAQITYEIPIEELVRLREGGMKYEDIVKHFQKQGLDVVEKIIADRIREHYRKKKQGNEMSKEEVIDVSDGGSKKEIDENLKRTAEQLVYVGKQLRQEEQRGQLLKQRLKQTVNDNER